MIDSLASRTGVVIGKEPEHLTGELDELLKNSLVANEALAKALRSSPAGTMKFMQSSPDRNDAGMAHFYLLQLLDSLNKTIKPMVADWHAAPALPRRKAARLGRTIEGER